MRFMHWSCLFTLILLPLTAVAQTPSSIPRRDLEAAIVQLYTVFPPPAVQLPAEELPLWMEESRPTAPSDLSLIAAQQDAELLAGLVAGLETVTFNDLVTHALIDYRNHPEHRMALSAFLGSLAAQAQGRLVSARLRERAPYLEALDQVVLAVEWAYVFAFGAGMWNAAQELPAIARTGRILTETEMFAHVLRGGMRTLNMRQPLWIGLGVGASAAAIQTYLIHGFETTPLDPIPLLNDTNARLAVALAERTVQFRDQACRLSPRRALTQAQAQQYQETVQALRQERAELELLAPHAGHTLRSTDEIRQSGLECLSRLRVEFTGGPVLLP